MIISRVRELIIENVEHSGFRERDNIRSLNENETISISDELVKQVYRDAIDKYNGVDLGDIPATEGDITKLKTYSNMVDSINLMRNIVNGNKFEELDIISRALSNIQLLKDDFSNAYDKKIDVLIMIYEVITLSIIHSVSYLITMSVEYVKNPGLGSMDITISQHGKKEEDLIINNLNKFNKTIDSGDFRKLIDSVNEFTKKSNFTGESIMGVGVLIMLGMLLVVVPLIRELIYQFFYMRVKFSDYCLVQSEFLKTNIDNVKNSSMDNNTKKNVIRKQEAVIRVLDKIRNTIELKVKDGSKKAKSELSKNKIDYKKVENDVANNINNRNIII